MHRPGLAVILPGLMATGEAAAAIFRHLELHRHPPVAEGNRIRHHLRLLRPMHFVAEFAAPAPNGLVHMKIVEINGAVTEPGGIGGIREHEQIPLVAGKAELVCLGVIIDEWFIGVAFRQQFPCHVVMWVMAEMAARLGYRRMQIAMGKHRVMAGDTHILMESRGGFRRPWHAGLRCQDGRRSIAPQRDGSVFSPQSRHGTGP